MPALPVTLYLYNTDNAIKSQYEFLIYDVYTVFYKKIYNFYHKKDESRDVELNVFIYCNILK